MKRTFLALLAAACGPLVPIGAHASPYWAWTISNSPTDPYSNTGTATNGLRTFYLWFAGGPQFPSTSRAEMALTAFGAGINGVQGVNGFTLAGPLSAMIVTAPGGCVGAPTVAAEIHAFDAPGRISFGPNVISQRLCTADCTANPTFTYYHLGYSSDGSTPSEAAVSSPCPSGIGTPVPGEIERSSWGHVKAVYDPGR